MPAYIPSVEPVRVLVVDDSGAFRRAARALLEHRGYLVVGEAGSIRDAIAAAAVLMPDAALIDIGLPDGPGTELAFCLRTQHPGLAVLLTSADPHYDPTTLLDQPGAPPFVLKCQLARADLGTCWPTPTPRDG